MARTKKRKRPFKKANRPGSPPGMLPKTGVSAAQIDILAYSKDRARSINPATLADLAEVEDQYDVVWLNVIGASDSGLLLKLAKRYGLHLLSLEDVINIHQRAKFESYESYAFCVLRMLTSRHDSEQLSIFQAGNVVITIQERDGDCLKPLRQRIENSAGLVRTRKSDFLVYALIDSVLDHYFPVLEEFDNLLGEYDDELTLNGGTLPVQEIHQLRRQLVDVRKWLRPHREMIGQILRSETGFKPETLIFVKDCYDHVTQLAEGIEHCLETCSSLRDFHFNAVNNKTNEVMKTLTIISTIFIPLSFLAGVYGMNFSNMPGLQWRYGFAILTLGMLTIGGGMLAWFYRRGWFR